MFLDCLTFQACFVVRLCDSYIFEKSGVCMVPVRCSSAFAITIYRT